MKKLLTFLLVLSSFFAKAKTVAFGTGSGDMSITSMSQLGLVSGDIVALKAGTYTSGQILNLNNITIINSGGLVTITARISIVGNINLIFSGTGTPGLTNGFLFLGALNATQADQANDYAGGGLLCTGHNEVRVFNADVTGNTNLIQVAHAGITYTGTTATLALYKVELANIHMRHSSYLVEGYFGSTTDFTNVVDSISIHDLTVDTMLTDNRIVYGTGIYRCNFYNWTVHNAPVHPFLDMGSIFIHGNGTFHHIYIYGGWGYLIRGFVCSLGSAVQDTWVYDCVKLNTEKYGFADIEVQPGDLTSSGVEIVGSNIHVINNTEGDCRDYNDASNVNPWVTPIYLTPSLVSGYTVEVRNNVRFNNAWNQPSYTDHIVVNFTAVTVTASNNADYVSATAAGFNDSILVTMSNTSPLIDAGTTVATVSTDLGYIPRPQGSAYDIGAREYKSGTVVQPQPPVSRPGSNQTITLPTSSVTLSGTASTDPDGTITAYAWTRVSGPNTPTITTPSAATTTVTGLIQGTYVFQLTVTDNSSLTNSATVSVFVNAALPNSPPTANAGVDQSIKLPTSAVTLTGSGTDIDGTITAYLWTNVSGPNTASFSASTSATTTASGLIKGTYVFQLRVTDNGGLTGTDQITVVVNAANNVLPVANAGATQQILLPTSTATLNGTGSSDADGTIVSYSWLRLSGPNTPTLTNGTTSIATISGLIAGSYVYQLTVTDNNGGSSTAQTTVVVSASSNKPPVPNPGANRTVLLPVTYITLDGSTSYDPDGAIATYSWAQLSGPNKSTISTPSLSKTKVSRLVAGVYVYRLTVGDNLGLTATKTVTITVKWRYHF